MAIEIDLEKGDLILVGRFKNIKEKVKKFGKDKNHQLTINGRKMLTFRIAKTMPKKRKSKTASLDQMTNEAIVKIGMSHGAHKKYERKIKKRVLKHGPILKGVKKRKKY